MSSQLRKAGTLAAALILAVVAGCGGNGGSDGGSDGDGNGSDPAPAPNDDGGNTQDDGGNTQDDGGNTGAIGAPIKIPAFTITGNPLDVTRSSVLAEFDAECGEAGHGPGCVVVEFDVRPADVHESDSSCDTPLPSPAAGTTVDRDSTVTVVLTCRNTSSDDNGDDANNGGEADTGGDADTGGEADTGGDADTGGEADTEGDAP